MAIYKSVSELVGKTPLLEIANYCNKNSLGATVYAKLECLSPAGSVKDRAALYMIEGAEREGRLKAGSTIIEPTSGNTGIGLSAIGVSRGYRVIIVMPDNMSVERQLLMGAYGAELVLTDGALGMAGAIDKANKLAREIDGGVVMGQFDNPDNPRAHYETTGVEIWQDTNGEIDIFVAGIGTGGTLSGTGKYLKEQNPNIKIVGVEPQKSPYLTKGISGAHGLQGIGAGFLPKNLDISLCDEIITVSEDEAYAEGRSLARAEGILVGISSGAAIFVTKKLALREENKDKKIVVLLPDTGERYLSTQMYKNCSEK